MAIVRFYDFQEATLEQYAKVLEGFSGSLPPGYLLHAAGTTGTGFQSVDVFGTVEARDRMAARSAENKVKFGLGTPIITEFETHTLLHGPAS